MNAPLKTKPRHFLDLSDHDSATLKSIIADAKARLEAIKATVTTLNKVAKVVEIINRILGILP